MNTIWCESILSAAIRWVKINISILGDVWSITISLPVGNDNMCVLVKLSRSNCRLYLGLVRTSRLKPPIWVACVRGYYAFVFISICSGRTGQCDRARWWRRFFHDKDGRWSRIELRLNPDGYINIARLSILTYRNWTQSSIVLVLF